MTNIAKYPTLIEMVRESSSRKQFAGASGAGASSARASGKNVAKDEAEDVMLFDVEKDLGGEEVVVSTKKDDELKLVNEEEQDEKLVDYDSEPNFMKLTINH